MTDPQDIEVEPTPEERCSVAMAALRACCDDVFVSESATHYLISARCPFCLVWRPCDKNQESLIATVYGIRDSIVARRAR